MPDRNQARFRDRSFRVEFCNSSESLELQRTLGYTPAMQHCKDHEASRPSLRPPRRSFALSVVTLLAGLILVVSSNWAQVSNPSAAKNPLQRHYQSAQNFQAAGKLQAAAVEYRLFLGDALHRLALGRSNLGDFQKALPTFDAALNLVPSDVDLRLDYAEACRRAGDLQKAKSLAQDAVEAEPQNAKAHLTLGKVLSQLKENQAAIEQFEAAVGIQPDFENGFALANECLHAKDEPKAARIFSEMLATYGDSPAVGLKIGTAYAEAGYPDQAAAEFKKVIAKNPKFPGAHYSLGAAYLVGASDAMYPQAAEQFRAELELNPDDFLSRYQLGFIELSQHKLKEAEADLTRAAALDPTNPDSFLSLGQLYMETNRPAQEEAALRKSIALTADVTRNHYQVQRAHYMLARLLLQTGHLDEGKAEMQISQELMRKSVLQNQGVNAGPGVTAPNAAASAAEPPEKQAPVNSEQEKQVEAYEREIAPAIADSYNNLGAIAAGNNQFDEALGDFEYAYAWNPSLSGLDFNWGKAAFTAYQFPEAIGPLTRYLKAHPDDAWARSALGTSLFMVKNYADAAATWQPIEAGLPANPQLDYMYSVALIKTGKREHGVARLRALAQKEPLFAPAHEALGEAFVSQRDFKDAAAEFREVVKLNAADFGAKYNLALALIELKQNDEAEALLVALAKEWQDPHVYFTLGKLQLAHGDMAGATANLEKAAAMSPKSGPIHHELADAYRRDGRAQDADRETKLYQVLESAATKTPDKGKPE